MSVQALTNANSELDKLVKLLSRKDDKGSSLLSGLQGRKPDPAALTMDIFQLNKLARTLSDKMGLTTNIVPELDMTQKLPEQPMFPLPKAVTEPFALKEDKKILVATDAYELESKVEDVEGEIEPGTPLALTKENVLRPAKDGDNVVGVATSAPSREGRVQALLRGAYDNEPEDRRRLTFVPPPPFKKYESSLPAPRPWTDANTDPYEPNPEVPGWLKRRENDFADKIIPKVGEIPPPARPSTKIAWSIYDLRQQQADPARWKQRTADVFGILEQVLSRQLGRTVSITECNGTVNFAVPLQISVRLIAPVVCTLSITEEMDQNGETRYTAKTYSKKGISDDTEVSEITEPRRDEFGRPARPSLEELTPVNEDAERKRNETVPPKEKTNDLEFNEREITL